MTYKLIFALISTLLFISCSPEDYEGTYRAEDGSFIKLKEGNKFEFGIRRYPELFTGIYKSYDRNIEFIFRYPFFGRDAITTLSMKIEDGKEIKIKRLLVDADNFKLKVDVQENRAYISINDEVTVYRLNETAAQERIGIFYDLTKMTFVKLD